MKSIPIGTIVFSDDPVINNCRPDLGVVISVHDGAYTILWQTDLTTTVTNNYIVSQFVGYYKEWIRKNVQNNKD